MGKRTHDFGDLSLPSHLPLQEFELRLRGREIVFPYADKILLRIGDIQ